MLKEVLMLLKKGNKLKKLDNLPNMVNTIKRYAYKEILHIKICSKEVILNPKKVSLSKYITII